MNSRWARWAIFVYFILNWNHWAEPRLTVCPACTVTQEYDTCVVCRTPVPFDRAHVSKKRWTLHRSQSVRRTNQRGCNFGHYATALPPPPPPPLGATNTKASVAHCHSVNYRAASEPVVMSRRPTAILPHYIAGILTYVSDCCLFGLPLTPRWHNYVVWQNHISFVNVSHAKLIILYTIWLINNWVKLISSILKYIIVIHYYELR